jgi:hypothetical protein
MPESYLIRGECEESVFPLSQFSFENWLSSVFNFANRLNDPIEEVVYRSKERLYRQRFEVSWQGSTCPRYGRQFEAALFAL